MLFDYASTRAPRLLLAFFILSTALLLSVGSTPVEAATGAFTENFSTSTYRDAAASNVTGWGTGVISIPHRVPLIVGSYDTPSDAKDVWVSGTRAYVADSGDSGLQVIDISDPTDPTSVANRSSPYGPIGVHVIGSYAYVVDGAFQVVNLGQPTFPIVGSFGNEYSGYVQTFGLGGFAYIANMEGLQILDMSTPTAPTSEGYCDTTYYSSDVFAVGNYAYVTGATMNAGSFNVVNVAAPTSPSVVATVTFGDWGEAVWVSGNYAYVAAGGVGLRIMDITTPGSAHEEGYYDTTSNNFLGVCVAAGYAYVADVSNGLRVINVANPASPTLSATCNTPDYAQAVHVAGDYAYVADRNSGLQVIRIADTLGPLCSQYFPLATAQSTNIVSTTTSSVVKATLTCVQTLPSNTATTYSMSADGGVHWEQVTPGAEHAFAYQGKALRWRADLTTADPLVTPSIDSVTINYRTKLDAPTLTSPADGLHTADSTPTFSWGAVTGTSSYLLQLDRVPSFDSSDLANFTASAATFTLSSALADGLWYWRVAARDAGADLGYFSAERSITIDATPPSWDETPSDQNLEFGGALSYDLNASDPSGLGIWSVNDTADFAIDSDGVLANVAMLPVGVHGVLISVSDALGNINTTAFNIIVEDTTSPQWIEIPTDQAVELGASFWYDVNATDLSGVDYWLNDTFWFRIDERGYINDSGGLNAGVYGLEVRAYDPYGQWCSAEFTVTVQETSVPTWDHGFMDKYVEFGGSFYYDVNATDPSGIYYYSVNDTVHFAVDYFGVITNVEELDVGAYGIEVRAHDYFGHSCSAEFSVLVADLVEPCWVETPTDQALEAGDAFAYDVNATDVSGIDYYWINDPARFSVDDNGLITNNVPLSVDTYELEVRAFDMHGLWCWATFSLEVVDNRDPFWLQTPIDQYLEFGFEFVYDVNATDGSGISYYWLNSTIFVVDAEGVIHATVILNNGAYGVEIRAYDPYGRYCEATFRVVVSDTTPPSWDIAPTDQTLQYGEQLMVQLEALDPSGIAAWTLNDTVHFSITTYGYLTSAVFLAPGRYGLNITATDGFGNALSAVITVTVVAETTTTTSTTVTTTTTTTPVTSTTTTATTGPTGPTSAGVPMALMLGIAGLGVVALLVVVLVLRKRSGGS